MNFRIFYILPIVFCVPVLSAHAHNQNFLGLSIGYFNVLDGEKDSAVFRAEYIKDSPIFIKNLKPWGAIEATTNATFWVGGGLSYDFWATEHIYITPSLGAGLYRHGAGDKDLNGFLQFRTGIELGYVLKNQSRIGLSLSHTSNAGLRDKNPGAETIAVTYKIPLGGKKKE